MASAPTYSDDARRFADRDAWSDGRAWFEARAAEHPEDPLVLSYLGFFVVKESRFDTARGSALVEQALQLDPRCALAVAYRAMICGATCRGDEALRDLALARDLGLEQAEWLRVAGWIYLDLWMLDEAIEAYHALVELVATSTSSMLLATAYLQAGRLDEARSWACRAAELDPDDVRAWTYAGVACAYGGQLEAADELLARASQCPRQSPLLHHTRAWVAVRRACWAEAEGHLLEVLRLDPLYVTSIKLLGDVRVALGRLPEARACYERSLELFPSYDEARKALEALDSPAVAAPGAP